MKTISLFFLINCYSILLASKMDTLHIHYFKNGKLSTIITSDYRSGMAIAYTIKGDTIYKREVRSYAGHASVNFTHYPSGAVKNAAYSSAPDAGIQWYKDKTLFSEEGSIIDVMEDSYPRRLDHIIRVNPKTIIDTLPKQQNPPANKPIICNTIHENFVKIYNHSEVPIKITMVVQNDIKDFFIAPGGSIDALSYISSDVAKHPDQYLSYHYQGVNTKGIQHLIVVELQEALKTVYVFHLFQSTIQKDWRK